MNKRAAFSLVEVLVAMVLVTMLTATGMFAYKMSLDQVKRTQSITFDDSMVFAQLKNLVEGCMFYVYEKKDNYNPSLFEYAYFFQNTTDKITFISQAPIYNDRVSLVQLELKENRLYYKEQSLYDGQMDYKQPKFRDDIVEYVLLDNIDEAFFSFEKPIELEDETSEEEFIIPKLIILNFQKNTQQMQYIFAIKSNFYKLKTYLFGRKVME